MRDLGLQLQLEKSVVNATVCPMENMAQAASLGRHSLQNKNIAMQSIPKFAPTNKPKINQIKISASRM